MKKILFALLCSATIFSLAPKSLFSQWLEHESAEPKEDHADDAMRWFYERRAFGLGYIPQDGWINAVKQKEAMRDKYYSNGKSNSIQSVLTPPTNVNWTLIGPANIVENPQFYTQAHAGRVNTIVTDPTNDQIAYLGAANGGIWKTTNAGISWHPTSDNAYSLAMGALAIDPSHPNILYAGTGEYWKADNYFGAGMLKSTDAGKTWNPSGLGNVGAFSKVIVNPHNSSIIYAGGAGSGGGFYLSSDAGITWSRLGGSLPPGDITDISYVQSGNTDILYVAIPAHGIFLSADGGNTWNIVNNFALSNGTPGQMRRVHVAADPKNWHDVVGMSINFTGGLESIQRSTDGGNNWDDYSQNITDIFAEPGGSGAPDQGWYDAYLVRDPSNPDSYLVGGISVWQTQDGGSSWSDVGLAYHGGIHPDQHFGCFSKTGSDIYYTGCDGGIAISIDRGSTFTINEDSLAITQSYGIAVDQAVSDVSYTANQDNGTLTGGRDGDWTQIGGGDGGTVAVDAADHSNVYFIIPGKMQVYPNSNGINSSDSVGWLVPLAQDENNRIMYTGSRFLYFLKSGSSSWTKRSKQLATSGYISAIAPAGDGKNLLIGTTEGGIWSTTDNGATFTNRSKGLPGRDITAIKVSPTDTKTFYTTLSGFGASHVMKTTDLGATWTDISSSLPDISCNAIVIDKLHPTNLYVGTDVGVFFSPDDGADWIPYGTGLPNTAISDLAYHYTNRVLRAGTHGRSMWEAPMATTISGITTPTISNVWYVGETAEIGWYGVATPAKIEISTDNAATWQTISPSASGNSFTIPTVTFSPTENALVRVSNTPDFVVQSQSFRIRTRAAGTTLTTFSEQPLYMYDLAYDKDDNVLWVTNFSTPPTAPDPKIYKIDPTTGVLLGSITTTQQGYFTGIKYDPGTKHLFVHQAVQSTPVVCWIYEFTTTGTMVHKWRSPCAYGTGIFVSGDSLFLADRNITSGGNNVIYIVSKTDPSVQYNQLIPTRAASFGPRCITMDPATGTLLNAWTDFQGTDATATLYDSYILRLNRDDGTELNSWFVQDGVNSATNVRGIELDPRNGGTTVWVTVLNSGNSAKILKIELSAPPPQPLVTVLSLPVNGANKLDTSLSCSWTPTTGATSYEFQLGTTDISLTNIIADSVGLTTTSVPIFGLQSNQTYYWRVRASNATMTGAWSPTWSFAIKNTNSVFDAGSSSDFFIKNYPNPYSNKTTIEYALPNRSVVSLKVMDLLGREIGNLVSGAVEAGTHSITFNAGSLAEGVYVIRLEADGLFTTHLMHVVK